MKYRMGPALAMAAILIGSAVLPATVLAEEQAAADSASARAAATQELQQELEERLRQYAEAMTAGALSAASDLHLPLVFESPSSHTVVLVSDL